MKQSEEQSHERSHLFPNGLPQRETKAKAKSSYPPINPSPLEDEHYWFWGKDANLRRLKSETKIAAHSDATVLIIGETGVGKEVIAK
ncbi:sigma-54 factor interaction domain-containing protein, partial [bacterium]|nr:sigma-54 factor interaction domain-containing protein [bacterium]